MSLAAGSKTQALSASACRFLIIEDDALLRDLLANLLAQKFQPAALHAFATGSDGLAHAAKHDAHIAVVDLGLPDLDGREIIRQLRHRQRNLRIVVLTAQVDATLPAELVALGVAGYVDKAAPLEHTVRAVERVLAGGMYFFAGVMPTESGLALRRAAPSATVAALSAREREVARFVAGGLSSKEIAQRLELSVRTVENYRANLMQKIGVRDTAGLVRWCLEQGLG